MISNKYFIVEFPIREAILRFVVEEFSTRINNDKTKAVVKLPIGCNTVPLALQGYTEYDHEGIREELSGGEWNPSE